MTTTRTSSNTQTPEIAIMFLGNIGAGKSALLSQIGGEFESGVKFRQGLTKGYKKHPIKLNTNPPTPAVLIDVPGLFEPDERGMEENCKELTKALGEPYLFKLVFVLKADNRGPSNQDLTLMSRVNSCVLDADAQAKVEYQVIINQTTNTEMYNMYQKEVAHDNFQSFFSTLRIKNYSFDISIKNVLLFMQDDCKLQNKGFAKAILELLAEHVAIRVSLVRDVSVTNEELTTFEIARAHTSSFLAGVITTLGVIRYVFALL
ncbi:hypothetical protein BGW41_008372 [Actinomortierella wolfii]|nr:hypothetical protein BGW41_008372 [Actinomortierella wolfii]